MIEKGLTQAEVTKRQQQGRVNTGSTATRTTFSRIITRNVFTVFNFVNLVLAIAIIFFGEYRNALFILVAIFNTLIGIINEVRAKKIIDKLSLISEKKQTVIRDGQKLEIPGEAIVEDDYICFSLGSQIPVDAVLLQGQVEVNESFITGESDNIMKKTGDCLLSGSFVVSGQCTAQVTAVGASSLINKINNAAAEVKPADSKLFIIMNAVIKVISTALIPIGILLLLSRLYIAHSTIETAVTATVAALISMIPQGLVLLMSSVMALSAIRLAKQKVLVQNLNAIETLARVDTICIDKTGTITTGKMQVRGLYPSSGHSETELLSALTILFQFLPADNATSRAIKNFIDHHTEQPILNPEYDPNTAIPIPFSSERKYSGVKLSNQTLLMGAIEFLTEESEIITVGNALAGENRLIAVIRQTKSDKEELIGFVVIEDEIRKNANAIFDYYSANNITPFLISGDSINTVVGAAQKVGMTQIEAVDLSQENPTVETDYDKLIEQYNIFTRVKPHQKKLIIRALKKAGHTVAMTGDGVNDVLAMREADCSLAIGDGADAARRVAAIVLLDSDFSAIPSIIAEGRQTINNIERSATLFLSKTTYAALLSVLFVFLPFAYPFVPIGMTFINFITIGFPAFALALQPNHERIKNQFVRNILCYSLPTGIVISLCVVLFAWCKTGIGLTDSNVAAISAIITLFLSFILILRISKPINRPRRILLILILLFCIGAYCIPFVRNFYLLALPDFSGWLIMILTALVAIPLTFLFGIIGKRYLEKYKSNT